MTLCNTATDCFYTTTIMSGFLFNVSLDPFLEMLNNTLAGGRGMVRACADDIGAALRSYVMLKRIKPAFDLARELAGLGLGYKKCLIVPTSAPFSSELQESIKNWLRSEISEWVPFKVVPSGRYLGFQLGPETRVCQWTSALRKFSTRAKSIGALHVGDSLSAHMYNSQAVSVLGYLFQLVLPPPSLPQRERAAMQSCLHIPTHALTHTAFFALHELGGPKMMSVSSNACAARFRTALKTVQCWRDWLPQLR